MDKKWQYRLLLLLDEIYIAQVPYGYAHLRITT